MTKISSYYLIVPATGTPRVVSRRVALRNDEVAFPLRIAHADGWGRYQFRPIEVVPPTTPAVDGIGEPIVSAGD